MSNFWKEFGKGFKQGWNGTLGVFDKIPVIKDVSGFLPRLHKGGKVPRTQNYRLRAGEVVLNKGQLTALKKAKTAKGKQAVINRVQKRRPKPMKGQKKKRK